MKQSFAHRLPSHVTLLNDPWQENLEARERVNRLLQTAAISLAMKSNSRRKPASRPLAS